MSGPPSSTGPTRVILDVKGNVDDWKEGFKQFLLVVKDSEGYFRYRWGPWEEDYSKLEILAIWAPTDKREDFGASVHHQKAIEALKPILKSMPSKCPRFDLDVRTFAVPPPTLVNSPICEVITIRQCSGDSDTMGMKLKNAESLPGCLAAHSGIAAVDSVGEGNVWLGFVAWKDLESSKAADKTTYIPDGFGVSEVHHVNFNFPIKGYSVTNPGR